MVWTEKNKLGGPGEVGKASRPQAGDEEQNNRIPDAPQQSASKLGLPPDEVSVCPVCPGWGECYTRFSIRALELPCSLVPGVPRVRAYLALGLTGLSG